MYCSFLEDISKSKKFLKFVKTHYLKNKSLLFKKSSLPNHEGNTLLNNILKSCYE
jgi:hypothetical protein